MGNNRSGELSVRRRSQNGKPAIPADWQPPDLDAFDLQHRFGDSVLLEFIRGHSYSAILRELVQNEYDAGGRVLQVTFGDTGLEVTGNGTPIDRKGWRRLSVTLGTGSVPDFRRSLEEKANGIGSKNFGLRSLFLFGDRIYVRSNGYQTLLDLRRGTPKQPRPDSTTTRTRGVRINVPYRTDANDALSPFTIDSEAEVLNDFAAQVSLSLLKLAHYGTRKSLGRVIVTSARTKRQIVWKQNVKQLTATRRGVRLLARRITMTDSKIGKTQSEDEYEWQRRFELPPIFHGEHIPGYFRDRGPYIRIGVSLRTKRGRLDPAMPAGIAYYPIGVEHAYTGNSVCINAPFEMDADRSALVDHSNSPFNAWLLGLTAEMTLGLLHTDWFGRFGVDAYRAVGFIDRSALPTYSQAVEAALQNDACWPSRSGPKPRKRAVEFSSIQDLNLVSRPSLDLFLDNNRYLDSDMNESSVLYPLAKRYGAKDFTINSLVRLRCAGKESDALQTSCKEGEACYYYTDFPGHWMDLSRQERFAFALDDHYKQLSKEHRHDLAVSATTLTASGSLDAAENLWFVPTEILEVCPVPEENRLHPALSQSMVLRRLCKSFNVAHWIEDIIRRLETGEADERERMSLYRYLVSVSGRIPRKLSKVVRNAPVLRDQYGHWAIPKSITMPGTTGIRQFRPALHLAHRDYAKDTTLARALRFKNKITGDDVVRFAQIVSAQPERAQDFERVLERSRGLLNARTIRRLASISFLRTIEGKLAAPSSLYLDTPSNRACIGPSGPYPAGNAKTLFVRLGCHSRPKAERIVEYLATLRQTDQPPPRPDILYPELVTALKRVSAPDIYKDEEILWTGNGYSAPARTILGEKWNKIFVGGIPILSTSSKTLRRAYRDLGVHDRPEQHHWVQFFVSLGETYRETPSSLTANKRSAMRTAYLHCEDMSSFPSDVPWLLNEEGHLHTMSDAVSGRFVIEDDVPMGTELRKLNVPIAFADNPNPAITSFFRRQGVRLLTEIRTKVGDRVGEIRPAPRWFREEEYVRRLTQADFWSALEAMAARDFPASSDILQRIRKAGKRLSGLEEIAFVHKIVADYRVDKKRVSVSAKYSWTEDTIHITWVRSRSGLEGVLASLIARECIPDGRGDHARFSDSLFRLITCQTSADLREYLEQRGIRWHPESEDDDQDSGDYMSDVEEAVRAAVRSKVTSSESAGFSSSRVAARTGTPAISKRPSAWVFSMP